MNTIVSYCQSVITEEYVAHDAELVAVRVQVEPISSSANSTPGDVHTVVQLVNLNFIFSLYLVLGFTGNRYFKLSVVIVAVHAHITLSALQNVVHTFVSPEIEYRKTLFHTHHAPVTNCPVEVPTLVPVEYKNTLNLASSTATCIPVVALESVHIALSIPTFNHPEEASGVVTSVHAADAFQYFIAIDIIQQEVEKESKLQP